MGTKHCNRYGEEEKAHIIHLHNQGVNSDGIARSCNSIYHTFRTKNGIQTFLSKEVRGAVQGPDSDRFNQAIRQGLSGVIETCDEFILNPSFARRGEIIYKTLKAQAEGLKNYDLNQKKGISQYGDLKLFQVMELSSEERGKIMDAIKVGVKTGEFNGHVDLLFVPSYKEQNRASLILPLYSEDLEEVAPGVRSSLIKATKKVFIDQKLFDYGHKNARSSWRDLVKYDLLYLGRGDIRFTGQDITRKMREGLGSDVTREMKGNSELNFNVSVHIDNSYFCLLERNRN